MTPLSKLMWVLVLKYTGLNTTLVIQLILAQEQIRALNCDVCQCLISAGLRHTIESSTKLQLHKPFLIWALAFLKNHSLSQKHATCRWLCALWMQLLSWQSQWTCCAKNMALLIWPSTYKLSFSPWMTWKEQFSTLFFSFTTLLRLSLGGFFNFFLLFFMWVYVQCFSNCPMSRTLKL